MNGSHPPVTQRSIASLKPYPGNARTHSKKQIGQIARSIERFGFTNPVLVGDFGEIIAGHGRVAAAKSLGWTAVPTISLAYLDPDERRAYVLADNKLALGAGWDREILAIELQALVDLEFEVELTGFSLADIDLDVEAAGEAGGKADAKAQATAREPTVTRHGETWLLDRHGTLGTGPADSARFVPPFPAGSLPEGTVALLFTDPLCCDAVIRDWQQRTGKRAIHAVRQFAGEAA